MDYRLAAPGSTGDASSRKMSVAHRTRRCLRGGAFEVVRAEVVQGGVPAPLAEGERGVLRALVGVMHDPIGAALCKRHVQRPEHQFGAKMVGHRPSHHPAAEHIEHDRQIHEPRQGRHVGDVSHPDAVRRLGLELAFDPVRRRTITRLHTRGARAPTPAHPGQPCLAHQTSHPFAAHRAPAGPEFGVDQWRPVGAPRALVDGSYRAPQLLRTI